MQGFDVRSHTHVATYVVPACMLIIIYLICIVTKKVIQIKLYGPM